MWVYVIVRGYQFIDVFGSPRLAEDFVNKQANSDDYEIITKFAY